MNDPEEQFLYEKLAALRREYDQAAKPYLDRLVAIRSESLTPFYLPTPTTDAEREVGRSHVAVSICAQLPGPAPAEVVGYLHADGLWFMPVEIFDAWRKGREGAANEYSPVRRVERGSAR